MLINAIFRSIQGEGRLVGTPTLFIRTFGCTRNRDTCPFDCDTLYAVEGEDYKRYDVEEVVEIVNKYKGKLITFTGGEPLLYASALKRIRATAPVAKKFALESNGDLLESEVPLFAEILMIFDYLSISPKELKIAKILYEKYDAMIRDKKLDVKVVTDLNEVGMDMIKYATSLMPLSSFNAEKDLKIKQKVWNYCVENKIKYCPRIHVDVWGKKRGV